MRLSKIAALLLAACLGLGCATLERMQDVRRVESENQLLREQLATLKARCDQELDIRVEEPEAEEP